MQKNNAILLCGGIGRRMAPIPKCNKSLLNIKGEINLKHIIRILYDKGIKDIVLATNPIFSSDISNIGEEIASELIDLHITITIAENYIEGCNNVVTLASASQYIKNTYILETDQYYIKENLDFIRDEPYNKSYFFTQIRTEEDWGVCEYDNHKISDILTHNPDNEYPCLSGVAYIQGKGAEFLRNQLSQENLDIDYYWEELILQELSSLDFYNYYSGTPYSIEFDDISDLVNKKLMDPEDIANLIDDNHSAEKLNSMTNTTYKVHIKGIPYALRIPGYGTEIFVNRNRERFMESTTDESLRPYSKYYSNNSVKLTEFLEGYEVLSKLEDIPSVLSALFELHNKKEIIIQDMIIDLAREISDYESTPSLNLEEIPVYQELKSKVLRFLGNWFSNNDYSRVHRDLVPLNILIKDNDVKFIDWEYSGYLSKYWDIASLCCEFSDEYNFPLDDIIDLVLKNYKSALDKSDIYRWIVVVDFVWSAWSAAKYILGDDVLEYGNRRFNRAKYLSDKYMKEV